MEDGGPDRDGAGSTLRCPCGAVLVGATDDELVMVAREHLRIEHPELCATYTREHILLLAALQASDS